MRRSLFLLLFFISVPALAERVVFISDVDDTIRKLHVRHEGDVLDNALLFLRTDQAFAGMSELYNELRGNNNEFHYVTNAPSFVGGWLQRFLNRNQFPVQGFHPREKGYSSTLEFKTTKIEKIMADNPDARFVLIGDNGQVDQLVFRQLMNGPHRDKILTVAVHELYKDIHPLDSREISFLTAADLAQKLERRGLLRPEQSSAVAEKVKQALASPSHSERDLAFPYFAAMDEDSVKRAFADVSDGPAREVERLLLARTTEGSEDPQVDRGRNGLLRMACRIFIGSFVTSH